MLGIRNWLYKIKKWWAEGNIKFKEIEVDKIVFTRWIGMMNTIDELKSIPIQTEIQKRLSIAQIFVDEQCCYKGYRGKIKYIMKEIDYIKIGYYEKKNK